MHNRFPRKVIALGRMALVSSWKSYRLIFMQILVYKLFKSIQRLDYLKRKKLEFFLKKINVMCFFILQTGLTCFFNPFKLICNIQTF